jgi:hypothetical protein
MTAWASKTQGRAIYRPTFFAAWNSQCCAADRGSFRRRRILGGIATPADQANMTVQVQDHEAEKRSFEILAEVMWGQRKKAAPTLANRGGQMLRCGVKR